jgi:hypothetical protein
MLANPPDWLRVTIDPGAKWEKAAFVLAKQRFGAASERVDRKGGLGVPGWNNITKGGLAGVDCTCSKASPAPARPPSPRNI